MLDQMILQHCTNKKEAKKILNNQTKLVVIIVGDDLEHNEVTVLSRKKDNHYKAVKNMMDEHHAGLLEVVANIESKTATIH